MKMVQADDQQSRLVNLADTQQIREIAPPTDDYSAAPRQSRVDSMILVGIVIAIALAAGALGLGVISLVSSPDAVAGPQGPTGLQGSTGAQGVQGASGAQGQTGPSGPAGPKGATGLTGLQGPAGPAGATGARGPSGASGTVVASTTTSGTSVLSSVDPPVGSAVTATATCPQGEFALGGGAQVTAPGVSSKSVVLRSSYPTSKNGWRAVGSVIAPLGTGEQMTVRPYVLCGKASHN